MSRRIYLDNAATTEMLPEVVEAMEPYFVQEYGNASTSYELGREARNAVELAREQVAACIMAQPSEIFFTSGGSESDNWAIKNTAGERKHEGRHIITSRIEHHAVLNSCKYLEELGYRVTYLNTDRDGIVDRCQLEKTIRESEYSGETANHVTLISIMYANNEIGTIQPIQEIGKLAQRKGILFHTDAVQAMGQLPIAVRELPVDLLSASAHKFHGPKGVGFLYVREGVELPSFIHGGGQERGKRAGTENVAGIVGMAKALEIANGRMRRRTRELTGLRDYFVRRVRDEIADVRLNGHDTKRLPGNVNLSFRGVEATSLLVLLEENGICASAGSACNSGVTRMSHVIQAIDVPAEYAYGTIRFSLGSATTLQDINATIDALRENVQLLRGANE